MHIVLLTHYFPPEVNAPANRSFDHALSWARAGHRVTVVTTCPSHPLGKAYPGYSNRWTSRDVVEGIEVIRIWTWLAANRGTLGRMVGFLSFFLSVLLHLPRLPKGDVVVSTSPQFFCGLAGWLLRRRTNKWVLEIRDLWPESIVAVGAMKRSLLVRALEHIETWAYRRADLVVAVSKGFVPHIAARRGRDDVAVIRNGVRRDALVAPADAGDRFRDRHGLGGKFVATYLGTHGMAHALDRILDAAALLRDRGDIVFMFVGEGAERERLARYNAQLGLANVVMLGQVPRGDVPAVWSASDAALVTLRRSDTFTTVLPSKMFEAMATATPIVLGVEGEAAELLADAEAGIAVVPEDAAGIAEAVCRLADDKVAAARFGSAGRVWFENHADREALALAMLEALEGIA